MSFRRGLVFSHLLFVTLLCYAQNENVRSQVVDKEGKGIPFASVGMPSQNFGVISYEDGTFSLASNFDFQDSIEISALGYEKLKISYLDFVRNAPQTLTLKELITVLKEVVVVPDQFREITMGIKQRDSRNHFNLSSPVTGMSIAMLFDPEKDPVWLKSAQVVLGKVNMDSFQVRCRILSMNEENKLPGVDLAQQNLIKTVVEESTTLTFELDQEIWIDRPFFVCFEWVTSRNQFKKLQELKDAYPAPFLDQMIAENPGLKHTVRENRKVIFRDASNKVVKEIALTKNQRLILQEKRKASPQLKFKIQMKGDRSYYGSSATGRWSKIPHEALISVNVFREKDI